METEVLHFMEVKTMKENNVNVIDTEAEEVFEEMEEPKKKSVIGVIKDIGGKAVSKVKNVAQDIKDDPQAALEKAGPVLGIGVVAALALKTVHDINKIERTVYSEEIGETVELKRKLTNEDKVDIDYRMSNGQTKIQAMRDKDLIKMK